MDSLQHQAFAWGLKELGWGVWIIAPLGVIFKQFRDKVVEACRCRKHGFWGGPCHSGPQMKSSPDQARGMVHMGYSRTEESTQFTLTFPHSPPPPPHLPGAAGAKSLVQMR